MQVVSDYVLSAIIAGILLFVVLSLKFRGEQTSVEATQFRAAKIATLSFIRVLEQDFNNIGAQYLPTTHLTLKPEDALNVFDTLSVPAVVEFFTQTDSMQAAQLVRYEWQPTGQTVELARGIVPVYEVKRLLGGAGGTLDGMSHGIITSLQVHLLRADSTGITNLKGPGADTQQLLVRLQAISPLGVGETFEELRWEQVFRPPNLWKRRDI
jgi:hypothetical protein